MDASARSHRRAVWLLISLALVLIGGWVAYMVNWVNERRALLAENIAVFQLENEYPWNESPEYSAQRLPALGPGVGQRMLAALCAPGNAMVDVYCVVGDKALPVEHLPKVERARRLFPEAEINVLVFQSDQFFLEPPEDSRLDCRLVAAISE